MVQEDDLRAMRREIERLKDKVDDIGHIQAQQVKADGKVRANELNLLTNRTRAQLYLEVDGKRSVTELAQAVGKHKSTASTHLSTMYEEGIVGADDVKGERVYKKNNLERALNLSREVRKIVDNS